MGHPAPALRFTAADFLAWDATQTVRHEYLRGEVFAMAGAGERHVTTALNVAMALRRHLAGTPCRTFITDMKLAVRAADAFFYPDVMVTCSAADAADPLVKREPVLVVEVLSPSTAAYDRGDKFAAYRMLGSLRELLFIDPDTRRADLYRLQPVGEGAPAWVLHPSAPGAGLRLDSVGLDLDAATLWAEVPELPRPHPAPPPAAPDASGSAGSAGAPAASG
jgi:Uma2 family endonuclease